ncbi:MAG TPA: hypothetical protein VGH56_10985 [Solirubrobacteraceae bacterium]
MAEEPSLVLQPSQRSRRCFGGLPFRAEIVGDETERDRLWDLADRVFPQFAVYRDWAGKAGRVIPIIQLIAR